MKKVIKYAVFTGIGTVVGSILGKFIGKNDKEETHIVEVKDRYKEYYDLLSVWLEKNIDGNNICEYFKNTKDKNIAIYGNGTLGKIIYKQLEKEGVNINIIVDKTVEESYLCDNGVKLVGLNEIPDDIDIIIVTPIYSFDSICEDIYSTKFDGDIVSLENIIYDI